MSLLKSIILLLLVGITVALPAQLALEFDINKKPTGSNPFFFVEMNGVIYFIADDTTFGTELWEYNINSKVVRRLSDIREGADGSLGSDELFAYNGRIYFTAEQRLHYYDVLSETITRVSQTAGAKSPSGFLPFNGDIYFAAQSSGNNSRLYRYLIDEDIIELVVDVNPDISNDNVSIPFIYDDKLFFTANDQLNDSQLWTYDPISDEFERYSDVDGGVSIFGGAFVGSEVYYMGHTPDTGSELFKYNFDTDEESLVGEVNPGPGSSNPSAIQIYNGQIIFAASNGSFDREYWKYDLSLIHI